MVTTEQVRPVWKCRVEGCNYTAAPTVEGYRKLSGHQLAHTGLPKAKRGFQLVEESTGEILAQKLEEATEKGFIATKPPEPTTTSVPPPTPETKPTPAPDGEPQTPPPGTEIKQVEAEVEAKAKEETGKKKEGGEEEITEPKISPDGIFALTIHLPADALTLFNLAKFSGLEKDGDKPFDEWLWDCVTKRFEKDYKMQLVLAPIEEQPEGRVKDGKGA